MCLSDVSGMHRAGVRTNCNRCALLEEIHNTGPSRLISIIDGGSRCTLPSQSSETHGQLSWPRHSSSCMLELWRWGLSIWKLSKALNIKRVSGLSKVAGKRHERVSWRGLEGASAQWQKTSWYLWIPLVWMTIMSQGGEFEWFGHGPEWCPSWRRRPRLDGDIRQKWLLLHSCIWCDEITGHSTAQESLGKTLTPHYLISWWSDHYCPRTKW